MTIWKSTNIPNIGAFVNACGSAFPIGDISGLPDGPAEEEKETFKTMPV